MTYHAMFLLLGICLVLVIGCTVSPTPILIRDEPSLLVDVAYDPHAGAGHSHPARISQEQIVSALRGLQLQGRDVMGTFGLFEQDRESAAFLERDVAILAPFVATGLAKASPRDLVRFYLVQRDSRQAPLITSGGLFLRNQHLYVILANGRTSPSSVQYENTYEPNFRLDPLLPIARFKFKVAFRPGEWRVATHEAKKADGWEGYLDESKVVVVDLTLLSKAAGVPAASFPRP
jgi:hypothetical protein